jgi:hypothetical protein
MTTIDLSVTSQGLVKQGLVAASALMGKFPAKMGYKPKGAAVLKNCLLFISKALMIEKVEGYRQIYF